MFSVLSGGDKRDRTADLLNAIQALSQLSYTPKFSCAVRQLLYYSTDIENVNREFENFWIVFSCAAETAGGEKGVGVWFWGPRKIPLCDNRSMGDGLPDDSPTRWKENKRMKISKKLWAWVGCVVLPAVLFRGAMLV